jgi:hypothetical protein
MAGFSPWASSGLLGGAGRRIAMAAGASSALWLAVLWVSMGTPPAPAPSAVATQPATAPAKPVAPPLRLVAAGGTPAPGGGSYNRFGLEMKTIAAPVNARGDVAFFAKLMRATAEEGLFLWHDGRASLVAAIGGAVPGGGTIAGFTERPTPSLNAGGKVAFAATIEGGRASDAVLAWSGGKLSAIAQSGARAPGVPGAAFFDFAPPALNDAGDAAFLATLRRGRETLDGIYLSAKGQLVKVVAAGDPAPGGGSFAALAAPVLNAAGTVAFAAVVEGGPTPGGVFVAQGTALRQVVGAGNAAPGGGVFTRISEHVGLDDAGRVAFGAFLGQGGRRGGVFLSADGGIAPVALLGDPAPGGGTFAAFGDAPSLAPDGSLAFIAAIDGGPGTTGVYASGPDGLKRAAGPGDMVADGQRLGDFPLNASVAAGPRGGLTFQSTLRTGDEQAEALVLSAPGGR